MNILFIGPYKQADEWGRKSRYFLSALKKTNHNITSRPLYFNQIFSNYLEPTEHRYFDSYDSVIQFTLAPFAMYDGSFKKNIGIFNLSTVDSSFYSPNVQKANLLDEIWVDSSKIHDSLSTQLADATVRQMGPFLDFDVLNNISPDPVMSSNQIPNSSYGQDRFMFYSIMGGVEGKIGLAETLSAYYSTFSAREKVGLTVIFEHNIDSSVLDPIIQKSKSSLGAIRSQDDFPPVSILNPEGFLPDEARMRAHTEGDCFVSVEYSLNINTVAMEAACFGSTPLINKGNEAYNVLSEDNAWGVESYEDSCVLSERPFPDMFTSHEIFCKPIIKSLGDTMREAYTNKFKRDQKKGANSRFRAALESDDHYKKLEDILCM